MARSKKTETETDPTTDNQETAMTETQPGQTAEESYTTDSAEESMTFTEDDFAQELWPENKNIHVYISEPKIATAEKPESKIYGKQYITGEFVVAEYQSDPAVEEAGIAGETMDFFFVKGAKRDRKKLQSLLIAVFGEIPRHFTTAADLANTPLVITVTHGKARKDKDTGEMVTPMYLDKIRPDRTVEQ